MHEESFIKVIEKIRAKDSRYAVDSYLFVREALDFTSKRLNKPTEGAQRHISGRELLDGIRAFALQEFGPLTLTVLHAWGVNATEDFGKIVFNLVGSGVLGKTEQDHPEDFAAGYDFQEAFAKPFLPRARAKDRRAARPRSGPARRPSPDQRS
ncbi:MAG: hypothetical protein QME60_02280 [Verrucomicrobiota bacterium]|nr:hypothetical protein [Verrucomicrobiota bacterium]